MKLAACAGSCLAALVSVAHAPALAEGPELSFAATIATELIASGESLTRDRPGAELVAGIEAQGFFTEVELRTLRIDDNRWEVVGLLGYRREIDDIQLELGVARAWADRSGSGDTDVSAGIEWAADARWTLGFVAAYAPRPRDWVDVVLTADYELDDRTTISGAVGRVPADRRNYANLGASYALTDQLEADVRYHRSRKIGHRMVLSLIVN